MEEEEIKCPKCGNIENFHFNYNYTKKDYWSHVEDVLCNECGEFFELKNQDNVQDQENDSSSS